MRVPETETSGQNDTYRSAFSPGQAIGAVALLLLLYGVGFGFGGEFEAIMTAGLEPIPVAILAVLAYVGAGRTGGRLVAIFWLLGLIGAMAVLVLSNSFMAVLTEPVLRPGDWPEFVAGGQTRLLFVFLGLGLSVLVGGLGFVPGVRAWLSRRLPFEPTNFVHTIALVMVITLSLLSFVPLIFLGQPPLLTVVTGLAAQGETLVDRDNAGLLRDQLYKLLWLLPAVALAVGYGTRRNLKQALLRLGLVKPTRRQVLAGIGLAMALVWAVNGLDHALSWLWAQAGWARTDGEAFGLIIDFALTPVGAVVLGITAGLGEELAVRGVLQPRMGIWLSNLLFTALHALQYSWDGVLIVFLIGLVFGFIRQKSNTTTCAIIHGLYDFIIIMAVVLEVPGFEF